MENLVGKGRKAIDIIFDKGSFKENTIDGYTYPHKELGEAAVIGTALLSGEKCTVIANDSDVMNPRFSVVYAGIVGMEEGYKMSHTVYETMKADEDKPKDKKRPIILIVDTPGNAPGKKEEIIGINKATGSYQLALTEARESGHPIIAMVIGRAVSGGFLCHGLLADRVLSLSSEFDILTHIMSLSSISRITKIEEDKLHEVSSINPSFSADPAFFYLLGGIEEIVNKISDMRDIIIKHVSEVRELSFEPLKTGPWARGILGQQRGGRHVRHKVINKINEEFAAVEERYI